MTEQEILEKLTPLFRDIFFDDSIILNTRTTAADVARWDSLSHIDMIMLVEQNFHFRFPTREITRMKNVGDLVRLIQAHTG